MPNFVSKIAIDIIRDIIDMKLTSDVYNYENGKVVRNVTNSRSLNGNSRSLYCKERGKWLG